MRRVTCAGLDIQLTLECATLDEIILANDADTYVVPFRLANDADKARYPGATHVISVPGDTDLRGVRRLLISTPCGCYDIKLYFDCPMPIATGEHFPTDRPVATYCCPPVPDPVEEPAPAEQVEAMDNNGDNDETF